MTFEHSPKSDLGMQAQFGAPVRAKAVTVLTMTISAHDVGIRIVSARKKKGWHTTSQLAARLRMRTGTKGPTDEIVRLWETGRHVPPYPMVELLSLELEVPEEYLLFDIRRDKQLQDERRFIEYVNDEEKEFLSDFRRIHQDFRPTIREQVNNFAKRHPAPHAVVRRIGRSK